MADEKVDYTYRGNTTDRKRQFDAETVTARTDAVFPELPSPLSRIYLKVKDLNSDGNRTSASADVGPFEDLRKKPAVEVGLKFTF